MEKLRRLRRGLPAFVRGVLRRQSEILLPDRAAREYRRWIDRRIRERALIYNEPPEPGLLSILTPVWNQSPLRYLKVLAESVIAQNPDGACEWVILDNGCVNPSLCSYLGELNAYSWVNAPSSRDEYRHHRGAALLPRARDRALRVARRCR